MTDPSWYVDTQWARALGAVAVGLTLLCGVIHAGGPAALAREAQPVMRLAAAVYCMTVSAVSGEAAAGPSRLSFRR